MISLSNKWGFHPRVMGKSGLIYIFLLICFLYYFISEGLWGRTLGKWIMKLRVVRSDGKPLTWLDAVKRNVTSPFEVFLACPIAAISILANEKGKRVGDFIAGTQVIEH